ncbi:MAG: CinA family nicotinamide mononucleotide deamidase-related protein [Caldilineales bacterium]|nr:CinA family nicotinamide mononucleotide deamidase-related protein [Caldilineales bacterium]
MKAEIITTGTEILLGEIVDTNAAYIARQLRDAGVNLYYKTTVGDNRERLAQVLRMGLSRSDVLVVTGGLGPTVDDITREAAADAVGRKLEQRPELVERLREQFASWGRELGENNLRQSYLPTGAQVLFNPIGTAPGFLVEEGDTAILCLPGVPREMKRMMADHVIPYLQRRLGEEGAVIVTRTLHTAGMGESAIDEKIADLMVGGNPTVGLSAHLGRVDIRIAARASTLAEAESLLEPVELDLSQRLGRMIFGKDDDTLSGVVASRLRTSGVTLAVVETNTAGTLAASFEGDDRDLLRASYVAPTLTALAAQLGLDQELGCDAASAALAARTVQNLEGVDIALTIVGTTDPDQGFWSANRGETWLALAGPNGELTQRFSVGGSDEFTRNWLSVYALNFIRLNLDRIHV